MQSPKTAIRVVAILVAAGSVTGLSALSDAHRAVATAILTHEEPERGSRSLQGRAAGTPVSEPTVIEVSGIVQPVPDRIADVIVPMPGRVVYDPGSRPALGRRVRAGEPVAQLEQRFILHDAVHLIAERWPLLLDWLTARRALVSAEAGLERIRYQHEHLGAPETLLNEAEAAARLAREAQQRADTVLRMHDAQIKADEPVRRPLNAPISGTIVSANFTQGQMVYENQKLFTIVNLNTVWVEIKVPEAHVAHARRLWRREAVALRAPAFPDTGFSGRLIRILPALDETTRTLSFVFSVKNPGELLRLGMLVRASLTDVPATSARVAAPVDSAPDAP